MRELNGGDSEMEELFYCNEVGRDIRRVSGRKMEKFLRPLRIRKSGRRKKILSSVKGKVQDKAGKEEWLGGKTEQKEKEQRQDVLEKGA